MLDDLIKGVREYISDRFMSPLGAALLTSWCGWNYKFILIALSGEPVIRKLHLIRMVYQDSSWTLLLLGPAATAAIYLFLFPYPSRWVYAFTLSRRRDALDTLREIEKQTPLTKEESQALRDRFTQIETDHLAEKLRLTNALDSMTDQLRIALEGKQAVEEELLKVMTSAEAARPRAPADVAAKARPAPSGKTPDASKDSAPFTATHDLVLRAIGAQSEPLTGYELAKIVSQSVDITSLILNDLIDRDLIQSVTTTFKDGRINNVAFRATTAGLRYLLNRSL